MLELKKIAVTGGLASGKTTVCEFLKAHKAYVVSADAIVQELLENDPKIQAQVIDLLGDEVVSKGKIDKKKVAEKIFSDGLKLNNLEKIIHPTVFNQMKRHYEKACAKENFTFFVAEIPLLFETGFQKFFDTVITVYAHPEISKDRFSIRTGLSETEWNQRMMHQLPIESKKAGAHFIINNDGSLKDLESQVNHIVNVLS